MEMEITLEVVADAAAELSALRERPVSADALASADAPDADADANFKIL